MEDGGEGAIIPLRMHLYTYGILGNVNWEITMQQDLSW